MIAAVAAFAAGASAQPLQSFNPDIARAGMADAGMASAGGAFAIYSDAAASLFDFGRMQVGFSYLPDGGSLRGDYYAAGGYRSFSEKHTLLLGTRFACGPNYVFIGTDDIFEQSYRRFDYSVDAGYAYMVNNYLGLSLTARYLHQTLGVEGSAGALGFDLGAYAQLPLNNMLDGAWLGLAVKISDFGVAFDDRLQMPVGGSLGVTLHAPLRDIHSLTASLDMGYVPAASDLRSFGAGAGVQYTFMELVSLRAGYHLSDSKGFDFGSLGAGIRFMHLRFDMAWTIAGRECPFRNAVRIGVGLDF